MTKTLTLLCATITLFSTVPAAQAGDVISFHSPTKSVWCAIIAPTHFRHASPTKAYLRCDIPNNTAVLPPEPEYCKDTGDWGAGFGIEANGYPSRACPSDTSATPAGRTLQYGETIRAFGFHCTSRRTGMTCMSSKGHGFTVRREAQRLF